VAPVMQSYSCGFTISCPIVPWPELNFVLSMMTVRCVARECIFNGCCWYGNLLLLVG
jgi:hypothetical protein